MIKLKPFKANPVCPKCGGNDVDTLYHEYSASSAIDVGELCHKYKNDNQDIGEHLHRTCKYCKYEWLEKVKGENEQNKNRK